MGSLSLSHWGIILVVVILLFGGGKISGLMGDAAKGIRAFKDGLREPDEKETAQSTSAEPKKDGRGEAG